MVHLRSIFARPVRLPGERTPGHLGDLPMKTTLALNGLFALAGAGLVTAGGGPQQQQPAAVAANPAGAQPGAQQAKPAPSAEEQAIIAGVEAFTKLYSAANAEGLADLFIDDASIIDPEGNETRGKAAVAEMYATAFQQSPGLKVQSKIDEVRFLTPDVVRVHGESQLSSATGDASDFTKFNVLLVRRDGTWKIAEIRESAAPAAEVTPYERLQELEWMVGDWVDESDNNRVQSNVRWADNRSYLVRTYKVEMQGEKGASGTMFIGWDPQSGQIKSWLFDSNGGHGEALWVRTGDKEWVVKAQGVLHDGRPTSATQIHTIVNKDAVKTSSIDRIIGGQVAPDIVDIVMVRRAPAPAAATPGPKPAAVPEPPK
jgi:uncharacterized protein (TIGR02246 family)